MDHSEMGPDTMNHQSMGHDSMDHQGMNHATMDHASMGHEAMEHGSSMKGGHGMMMMSMTFHGGCNEVILFDFWKISTVGGLIGSMVGCFLLGILYEGLKFYREFLMARGFSSVPYNNVAVSAESSEREGDEASVVSSSPNSRPRSSVRVLRTNLFSRAHAFQTFLHLVSLTLSYFLMLIAMTFNSWLFGSVVGGLAAGYFLFGWKKTVMMEAEGGCH